MRRCRAVFRVFEVAVSAAGLVLLAPFFLVIALAIRLDSPGSAWFVQERVGRDLRRFKLLKFRTMVAGASQLGPEVTAAGDPRITRVGRVLRRFKIDELPQLWNVVRGDLSLVGPRPEVPRYVEMFPEEFVELLRDRPGITDPATLAFRHEEEILAAEPQGAAAYAERILPAKLAMSREYARRRTLGSDLAVLGRTLLAVLRG